MTTITVRFFTGKAISVSVHPTAKVSDVKDIVAQSTPEKWVQLDAMPVLTCKGHELRDHQPLTHYDIAARDALLIRKHFFSI